MLIGRFYKWLLWFSHVWRNTSWCCMTLWCQVYVFIIGLYIWGTCRLNQLLWWYEGSVNSEVSSWCAGCYYLMFYSSLSWFGSAWLTLAWPGLAPDWPPCLLFSPGSPYYYSAATRGPSPATTAAAYDRHWPPYTQRDTARERERESEEEDSATYRKGEVKAVMRPGARSFNPHHWQQLTQSTILVLNWDRKACAGIRQYIR